MYSISFNIHQEHWVKIYLLGQVFSQGSAYSRRKRATKVYCNTALNEQETLLGVEEEIADTEEYNQLVFRHIFSNGTIKIEQKTMFVLNILLRKDKDKLDEWTWYSAFTANEKLA